MSALISNNLNTQIQNNYSNASTVSKPANTISPADSGAVKDKLDLSAAALKLITGESSDSKIGSTSAKLQTDAALKNLQDNIDLGNDIIKSLDAAIVDTTSTAGSAEVGANVDIVV